MAHTKQRNSQFYCYVSLHRKSASKCWIRQIIISCLFYFSPSKDNWPFNLKLFMICWHTTIFKIWISKVQDFGNFEFSPMSLWDVGTYYISNQLHKLPGTITVYTHNIWIYESRWRHRGQSSVYSMPQSNKFIVYFSILSEMAYH